MPPLRLGTPNRRSAHYPRFSAAEFDRRRRRVREFMADRDLDVLLVYGDAGFHQAKTYYLSNYRPGFPTYLAFFADPAEESTIFVGISNHVQYVREVSEGIGDLRLLLPDPPSTIVERLEEAEAAIDRVGVVGDDPRYNLTIPHRHHEGLEAGLDAELVDVSAAFTRLISVAGEEEIEAVDRAAAALDAAMAAFEAALEPGITEVGLKDVLEGAAKAAGGYLGTDFISSAPMEGAEAGEGLTWKRPSNRSVADGDAVTTEIAAGYRGYQSQIHRPFAVGSAPTATYRDLFAVAEETYTRVIDALEPGATAADVHAALSPVEDSEFKIYDVMVHGYGGAYRHPFIGVEESNYWPGAADPLTAEWTFEPGMVIVVQPNVITRDETAGLQFGTTVVIEEGGARDVHDYPAILHQV